MKAKNLYKADLFFSWYGGEISDVRNNRASCAHNAETSENIRDDLLFDVKNFFWNLELMFPFVSPFICGINAF